MKKILVGLFSLTAIAGQAQTLGNSPYATYGVGDVKYDNTVEINAMGGISAAYISDFSNLFNFKNPAANQNLELTSFRMELRNENNFLKSGLDDTKAKNNSSYLSNISLAFPLSSKAKLGLGYQPYSSKNYNIIDSETFTDGSIVANNFRGEGTINTVQAGISYKLNKEISLGFRTNYYFGNEQNIDEITTSNSELINGYATRLEVKSFNFTLGTTYQKELSGEKKLTIGANTTFGNTSNLTTTYKNSTYFYNSIGEITNESIIEQKELNSNSTLPFEAAIGVGYGNTRRWFLGSQLEYKKGGDKYIPNRNFENRDSYKLAAGGWYLPNPNDFRNYFNRVIYRYGAYYERGGLYINDKYINKMGVTLGATLPFKNSGANRMSGLEIGLDFGTRGTMKNNLIKQNYINLGLGLNFSDKWFNKRLIN